MRQMMSMLAVIPMALLLATTTAVDPWNTPGATVTPVIKCPEDVFEIDVEASPVVGTNGGIRVETKIPLRKADYDRLIEEARTVANKADEEDDAELEEQTRVEIRRLKKERRGLENKGKDNHATREEPTIYTSEARSWSVLNTWSLEMLEEKYSDILLQRGSSIMLENSGASWNEVELNDYLNTSFREQKLEVSDYEEKLLAASAPVVADESDVATTDPQKFLEKVQKTASDMFVDYDTWNMLEEPEGEYAEGTLRQIQSLLLKDKNFRNSWLYKMAKLKDPAPTFTIGPPGSGMTFEQAQGRWLAGIQGSVRVFLYSYTTLPPTTHPQKTSIAEWLENIYPGVKGTARAPLEVTLRAGMVLHIPSGYHVALLGCAEFMFLTIWDQEMSDTPFKVSQEVRTNLANVATELREETTKDAEMRRRQENGGRDGEQQQEQQQQQQLPYELDELSEVQDEKMRQASEEGLAKLMKIIKRTPRRPDILLQAAMFEMLSYNHMEALQLAQKCQELVPDHTAPLMSILKIRTNEMQYLLDEVDALEYSVVEQHPENGDADPTEEQEKDMLTSALHIASTIKTMIRIDQSIRWSSTEDFVAAYRALADLEAALGSKKVRETIKAPDYVSADSTDPYAFELEAFD